MLSNLQYKYLNDKNPSQIKGWMVNLITPEIVSPFDELTLNVR